MVDDEYTCMHLLGCTWISMNIHRYTLIFIRIQGPSWISHDIPECLCISMDLLERPWMTMCISGYQYGHRWGIAQCMVCVAWTTCSYIVGIVYAVCSRCTVCALCVFDVPTLYVLYTLHVLHALSIQHIVYTLYVLHKSTTPVQGYT
jgi:hypothetical protein